METGPKKKKLSANGKRVYHDLQEAGGDCGTEEQFYDFLNAPREQGYKNRRMVYEDLKKSGGDPGTYEQFAQWLGVHPIKPSAPVAATQKPAAAQTAHPQQTAQAAAPAQHAPAAKPKPRNGQLTAAQRQAYIARAQQMSQQVGASVQRTRNRMGYAMATSGLKTPRVQLGSKASGGAKLGENSRVVATQPKFNPATGKMERVYLTELGNEYTSRAEADMEQNEIDEAVQQQLYPGYNDYNDKQAVAAQAPATAVAAQLWKEAQNAYDAERNANAKEVYGGNPWLRGGREMHVVDGATNSGKNEESRLKHFDLQKMSDNAWARVGKQMTASCYARLRKMYPNALERQVQASAEKEARALVQNAVYKYAVKMNAPKSQLDFFLRKAVDANLLTSVFRGLARYGAGTTGDMAAYEAANEEYGKSHRWTGVFGTATGMAFDPTNWVGGYIGSLGGKAALNIGGRFVLRSAPGVGARLFGSTMAGRLATGAASGMGMMGTYEGVKEAERQWVYGGHVNPETRENEGYSAGAVALSALKGAGLGAMTGMVSPLVGNVADKVVQTTTSATGKVATRLGEVATSAVAEGTIFAMPAVISGQESFVDAWTESMAMIVGFKGQHMVKSAGQVIAGMRPVANPRTMEERNKNRRGFAENLKRTMDAGANKQWNGNQPDVRFTKEELAELKQMGYGNLASLLTPTEKVLPKKKPSQPKHPKSTDGLTVYFDVGSGKKEAEADPKMKWLQQHPEFDGYATMEKLMQDPNVSQAARAKAYYMLTGRQLPMGTITGWNVGKDDKGNIWVKSVTSEGEVVTSRRFTDEASAKREEAKIIRQVELNTVDMGEQYKEMQANAAVVETAIKAVAPNADVNEAMRVYGEVKKGNKDYDSYKDLAKSIDEAIASNPEAVERAKTLLPENIRKDIAEQTGVEVDKALGKPEAERTDAEKQAVQTYLERLYDKSASDDAATPPDAQLQGPEQFAEAYAKHRTHKGSGQVVPATMKAGDRKVYVIDGDVAQYADKSGIDVAKSDKSIVVCDAETGKYEYTSPDQLMNVGEPAEPSTLSEAYMANERAKEAAANGEGTAEGNAAAESNAAANGDVSSDGGKAEVEEPAYTDGSRVEINGHEYDVKSAGEKTVVLVDEHGKELAWTRSALDAKLESGDAEVLEPKAEAAPDVATEGLKAGDVFADSDGNALTVKRVDGDKVVAVGADGKEQTYEDGMFEQMVESGVLKRAQKTEEPSEAKVDLTDNQGNSTPQPDLSSESKGAEQSSGVQAEVPQVDVSENAPMPMRVVGKGKNAVQEEDWLATTPKRGHDYVFKESGLDAEEANAFVENKVAEAEKNLEKVKGKAPKMGTNIAAYKEAKADYEARVAEAQKAVDYWHAVKAEHDKVLLEERRARKEKDMALYDDAVAQEEQRKAEMAQKAAEQEALGSNAVAPAIKEKWENAPKVDGGADEITLPNGEVVTGHYVLTESGAASASHQATNGFAETEGYPVDVNGETVNDRDYKRDAEAQQVTRGMAADYDSRALQSPVVVSGDGVVLSGNGRTMAGEIAALNGSDAKYNAYLRGHAGKFGFTTEQVEGFKHPRVVFVPDGEMPYTSETFAKFNQREQKSQSRTEMAVKLGKVVDDALFGRVMDVIGRHESLAEFYADDAATASVVKELADAGVIPQTEMAQLFDGGRLSESGQAMVEGVLVGKVFQGSPDAVRQITEVKSMRKAVMAALPEVVACHRLGGGYDLSKELAAAVDLVYKARKAGFKLGQHVSQHARQGNLFQLDDGATVADYNNAAVMMLADVMNDGRVTQLKKVLSFYNTQAADSAQGIGDMFAGGVKSKGQIINEVNELLNNGQEYDRRTPSVADGQGVGGEGGEQGDVAGPSHQGGAGSERGLSEAFDGLAAQLKTAEGEERKRVLGEMRDGIARFAEENGYPVPEFLLTRDDFLAAVPEKDRAKYVEWLDDGWHCPAYYEKGKVYYFVEGCDKFDKDVAETLAHEYTHADNAEFPENVNALTYALEDTHEVTRDELVGILETLSNSSHYGDEAERLESEGKNANPMLADEVIAHAVARMVRDGEQVLDGITNNPTLQFIIKRAYKVRENERRHNILAREASERSSKTIEGSEANSGNGQSVAEGESGLGRYGRSARSEAETGEQSGNGRSAVSDGKEVAAPSEEGAKVGVTDGEKSSATGDVVPSGKGNTPLSEKIATASAEVNTEPTEAQKEAGNYKKGHVQVGTFDITIEQPQGSVRKGTDADGKQWESKMNNTYGYIRGAVGVDGDHIDVFLSNDIDGWNGRKVFVVDQYNPDGSFDEHKVMLGFNDADEAKSDYLANYENGWENGRRIDVTAVNLEDFEKWIASSKRKTKPFGEYSSVKNGVVPSGKGKTDNLRQQKAVGKSAQPPTREESILRDVVIEHMKGSGLDVIGTEDGQRVLDMVNEDGAKEHRVYHGSGAEFDHFDHSHMGEGEGAQAYGWGTYVTEVRGIGEGYAIRSKNGISMSREEWSLKRSELESNIYRAKEQLPFLKGEYKAEVEAQISEWEEQLKDYEPHNYLYTVEIPDDNGGNYLDWNGPVPAETIDRITEYLREKYGDEVVNGRWLSNPLLSSKGVDVSARNGAAIYRQLERALGSDKKASQLLSSLGYAGIKYPAEFRSGGRKDDAKNYVIFNENDAEITDHVRFFKTKNGEAYGFTVGGKIYYDPRIANAETPVHEYAHLWASALKANNVKEWKNVVDLMKGTNVWEEVKKTYPELETDDEIADEVLATYSGRRGAERLREEMRKAAAEGDGVMGKAEAVSALQRVKRAIDKFWKAVADFLHIHYTSAEEVADRVMKDLLDGVDPRSMMDGGKSLRPETRVNVVEAEAGHGFKNYAEAKAWAKEHIARTYSGEETGGKGDIRISNAAVDKYLSQSAVDKSESKDVHLAVLKVLPDVIRESVDAEQHADFKKGKDGVRSAANGVNPNVTIHRLYGAVRMDGKLYRVKVTLKEDVKSERSAKKAYSYEATKIELLAGTLVKPEGDDPNTNNSITAAKLLNGVEKSYDGGKFFEDYNKIREQFIGEKGAAAADHADEVNTRLDNLSVAREMEAEKKDAKAIKMATGWERGADGKWRYEVGDVRFYDGLQLINSSVKTEATLDDLLEDNKDKEALFASYPSLKNMPVVLEDMGYKGAGEYNYGKGTIRLNTYLLTDDEGYFTKPAVEILNHEIQHAIQKIEGFARGGSPAMVRSEIKKQMAEVTKQIRQLRAEGKEAEAKELIKKNRGLYEASVGDDDFGSYKSLAGEVESRNVESRMGMSAEERRASLAAETEDVSREDQIFLTSGDGGNANSEMLQETGTENDYSEFAKEHGVDADMVKDYALGMETGNLHKADFALAEIRRTMRVANRGMKLSEFGKLFRPVQKELAERYGDIEKLRQEYIDAEMRERGVMEAARKRAEEETAKRKARADELRLLPEEELDRRYFEAVERGDDAAAREMLDEAARRKGYDDTESEYQGVGAWVAPSNPGYESDAARRADVEDNAPDVNVEDIALGYSLVDENYWHEPRKYMQTDATAVESVNAIKDAMAAIRRGEKDVKVKVYRAVPSSVKEGKLRNGDWVTPSRAYAKMHGEHRLEGDYRIIEDEVPVNELWWDGNDSREWGFDDGKGYKYKNVENSRKLNDLVTRDDNGEIIAPSKRFDENVEDVRYREAEPRVLEGEEALAALDNIFRENAASVMPETVSSLERFKELFRSPIRTFLGELVKVKDEVWNKILRNNRQDITGTVLPTIENADFAIRDTDGSTLYVKRFESERSGNLYNIVVVNKHGEVEDYVSSVHIKRDGNLRNKIKNGAELFLPQERNTDGTLFRNNSTPAAKVGNNFETLQLSTSEKAKQQAANDLAQQMHVEGEVEAVTSTEGLTGRQAKAKGWYDVRTGKVTIVLPNNKNAADVRETVFHEVVAHKGLRNLVGEEHFNTFLDNVYNNAEEGIKQTIDEMAEKKYNGDKRKATEEYMAHLAEDGEYVKPENRGFFAKVRNFLTDLLRKVGIKLGFKLTDNDLRYILWRSWKGLAERDGGSVFEKAEDVKMQHELGQTDEARSASGENGIMFREGSDELKDVVEKMKADVERLHEGELDDLRSGARAIGGRLSELNKAMRLQRAYDMSTVASVTELAKTMLKNGLLSEMSDYDVRRLLSVVNNVHGKGDIRPYVQKVVDMMVGNRLRNVSKAFDKLLAMRGKKVDARGVEVQGELDLAGQRMADVVWKGIGMSDDDVADMCADAQDRMMSANGAEAAAAATDYAGWQIVMRYNETIRDSKSEEVRLREDLKRAKEDYDAGRMTREAYMEFRESTNDAIRENRIERAEAYEELYEQLGGAYGESIKRAADFKAAEKARVLEIQHNANSDMEGRPARSYRKDTAVDKVLNSSPVQLLFAPLGTFDQMLRMFGSKNVKGEGYLWNRYMRGWLTATENEYTGYRDATAELDAKAAEVLGKGKTWADLFALERKLPKATVRVWDNGEMRELELPQGNLLYIYMVNKMADGRMKLRKMGVTEDDVAAIEDFLDPRLKEIGDWLQEVYLVEKRGKYNEVHERMFGAAMASIDNYFPLKILKDARAENVDVGVEKRESEMASTITGSVVKRTRNALALDLLNSDAFSVVLDHLQQMEHWSAFAEWNRDLNTLLSYKHFRNQVKNMRSAYGSGERLWEAFDKVARIAAGTYTPPKAFADKLAVNIAKGVTAAKISLRVFTALKQFTSFPAYLSDSNPVYLLKGVANPYGSWKWCMENLPLFEKRWKSRMAGDPRLLKNEMDWGLWRDNVVQKAAKWGMTPNGFVDALTVCIGARAMYETRRRKYIRYGYGLEEAERRAKQDASILYNQTQQSSEGAFLSALQVDRSWYSVLFTVFRNSSMSYTRQLYAALRNTGRRIAGGAKFKGISEAFMAKQMERDGIDPEKASKNAKAEYRKSWINDLVRAGVFGYVLQLAWNCGPYALYMLFGDDEKKGKEMWHDIWTHTAFGSVEGLTGGDVWSAGLQSLWNHFVNGEDFNANSVNKDMPLTSDLLNVVKKVGSDNYGAVNDVLNLLVQAGFGVNPQTLTDAAVAIYDYCGSDVETTKECALLVMRVMNCPQSQMDNIYFDEIDATGEEAKAMSVEEIAERYARYKALRSAPLRALSSDALKAAEKKPRERVLTEAKEQLDGRLMTEEAQRYLDEYEATKKKVTETRALADTDPKAFMQQMPALARSGEFRRYRRVGLYKSEVDKLTKKLLRTSDPAERRALFGKMLDARDKMLKQVKEME